MACADYGEGKSTGFVAYSHGGSLSFERTQMQEEQVGKRAKGPGRKRSRSPVAEQVWAVLAVVPHVSLYTTVCPRSGAQRTLVKHTGRDFQLLSSLGVTEREFLAVLVGPGYVLH